MVHPALVCAFFPALVRNVFSVEKDGAVVSVPCPSSINRSRQNSAAPFIRG